ncbi:MAG: MBL fold metallo-hydrolase [Candidatus Thorarchaeota archaeon]
MFEHIVGPVYFRTSVGFDSNIILIKTDDRVVLVDTGTGMYASSIERELQSIGVTYEDVTDIVLTHSHIDHIGGVPAILKAGEPKIYLHKEEADRINSGDMTLTLASTFGAHLPPLRIDVALKEGDVLAFDDVKLHVYHTPGHSIGSICLHEERLNLLITGDTMFPGGSFGRVDFPTGDPASLVASLKRIAELYFEIALPGHMNAITHDAKRSAMYSYEMARSMFTGPL